MRSIMKMAMVTGIVIAISAEKTCGQDTGMFHSFSAGNSSFILNDASIQPNDLAGNLFSLNYILLRRSQKRITRLSAGWENAALNISKGKLDINSFSVKLTDAFSLIRDRGQRIKSFVGYSLNLNPSFSKVNSSDNNYYSWNTVNAIGLFQSYKYDWYKNGLSLTIDIPVVGAASRPQAITPYPKSMDGVLYDSYSGLSLISLQNYKAVNASIDYHHSVTDKLGLSVTLQYRYSELETTLPVSQRSVGIQAGLSFKLK